jgi:hypothetical protein
MDGVSLSNARQAQRLKWSMERDKEIYMAQDEEIARQKADLRSKIEPLLTMERARRDLLAKFPPEAREQYELDREKDRKRFEGGAGDSSFSSFSVFLGLPTRRCRDELSPELRYQSDSSCRKIGKIFFLPVRGWRVAPFSCGQSSTRVVRGMSPKMK